MTANTRRWRFLPVPSKPNTRSQSASIWPALRGRRHRQRFEPIPPPHPALRRLFLPAPAHAGHCGHTTRGQQAPQDVLIARDGISVTLIAPALNHSMRLTVSAARLAVGAVRRRSITPSTLLIAASICDTVRPSPGIRVSKYSFRAVRMRRLASSSRCRRA